MAFHMKTGVPALFLVPAGEDSQPIHYDSDKMELEDLVDFVERHATNFTSSSREEL